MKEHIEGGTELGISIDGQLYINSANKKYLESISDNLKSDVQKQIEKKTVSHAGISTPLRSKPNSKDEELLDSQYERLQHLKELEQRQLKDLQRTQQQIKNIKMIIGAPYLISRED